jgi:NADPH-dependent glutamate synthase beta subunit-like oxidoreductase
MADRVSPDRQGQAVPPIAVSNMSTLVNKTGSWKYIRPLYQDRVAPCNAGCPVGIDIEGYMNLLREGRIGEAVDLLVRENPMPAVTGRVCHHPCETHCNRRLFDEPVSIHAVERLLGDLFLDGEQRVATPRRKRKRKIGIVGSGPAGLACAYHLARFGYPVTVYEAASEPGGMLRLGIPEFRLPRAVLSREIDRIRAHGVDIQCGVKVGSDLPWEELSAYDAVFVASGAHRGRGLGVEGEHLEGVRAGLQFLKEVNFGARPDLGRRVFVIGGGNTAMDCARTALRLGAEPVVLYRRTRAEMPAILEEVEEAEREGIGIEFLTAPIAFHAKDGRLQSIECIRMRLGPPDESGRRRPIPSDEAPFTLPADTVLTAIGEQTDLGFLPEEMRLDGSVVTVNEFGKTCNPLVYAGGDVVEQPRTVADALGAGKRAAIGIDWYLLLTAGESLEALNADSLRYGGTGNMSVTSWRHDDPVPRTSPLNEVVLFEDLNMSHFARAIRNLDRHRSAEHSANSFREVNLGLGQELALAEAHRCFNCGVCNRCELCLIFCPDVAISRRSDGLGFDIAMDYCKGCGVCAAECPRGAMTMTREGL